MVPRVNRESLVEDGLVGVDVLDGLSYRYDVLSCPASRFQNDVDDLVNFA
jgi:hypothetical protein